MNNQWYAFLLATLASAPLLAGNFEFVVIGDTRPRFESESFKPFEGLIAKINGLKPDLVVNLGDLIYGYGLPSKEKQWDKYEAVARTLAVPYYQVPGNHDTHSKQARRIYSERFGKGYQSFDHGDCHFVLLDNTENERWGYLGPTQWDWLRNDLKQTRAGSVFVFMHFPVWEPERITPEYYEFWAKSLHPLFKESSVRAVFGGHYHTYGPTREFDGIRYFITGGGGAELIPEYRKAGGVHHFLRVKVTGDTFDVRVVTEQGELTDPEADLMGGLQFAARNVSRIGLKQDVRSFQTGWPLNVAVKNPYATELTGSAAWLWDASAFSIQPTNVALAIPAEATHTYSFTLTALRPVATLSSLPQLEFNVLSEGTRRRFHREVRFLQTGKAAYQRSPPSLDGSVAEWASLPSLRLGGSSEPEAAFRSCYDDQNLYLALEIPRSDEDEAKESGFSDEIQIGFARPSSETEFGNDFLRLGLNSDAPGACNRTPGRKAEAVLPGVKIACRTEARRKTYEVSVPLRLLRHPKTGPGRRLILDLSFPVPEREVEAPPLPEPAPNSYSYRVRYGNDSLVPVYFVELNLERRPERR